MIKYILTFLLSISPALAADPWTKTQIGQQIAFGTLLVIDWGQTRDIKNHPELYEGNQILGPHPSDEEIDTYFATVGVGHTLIAHWLPSKRIAYWLPDITWRDAWQHFWIARQTYSVGNNYSLGVRIDF